jgi:hypothetical protein
MLLKSASVCVLVLETVKANANVFGSGTPIMKADFTKNGRRWLRRHVIPRQGHKIELDEDDILKATLHHETYTYNGTTLKGLGKYDDSRDYGISEVEEKKLVKVEVQRIINTITNDGPFLFSSNGVLSSTEKKSFEDVSNVIDQILCNFQIIKHDNARLLLEHCPSEMERGIKDFTRSRAQLYARYMQNQDQVEGYQPKTLQLPENNRLLYFQLVDYILGTMGRLLLRSAKGKFWESHIVSTLAMWATKLKNLSYDPALYASQSLSNGEDIISQTIAGVASKQAFILRIRTNSDGNEHKEFDALETEFNVKAQYYFEKMSFRYGMEGCLESTALSLLNSENVSSHASCFQACSLVYRAGLEGQPTLLSSDRDGDVSASSDPTNLNCSYSAMELLLKNVTALVSLQNCTTQGTDLSSREDGPLDTRTSLEWEWSDGDPKRHTPNKTWKTAQMDHVVSLVVCNGLTTTYIASAIDRLIHIASNAAKEEDPIIQFESPPNEFQALFKITTAEYLRKSKLLDGLYFDADVKGVADSPMRRRVRGESK